jgi:rhamnose transport system permease protein
VAHDSLFASGRPGLASARSILASWDAAIVLALVLVLVAAGRSVDNFATGRNAQFLLLDLIPIALVALPMTLIIVTGEIDLSVASTIGLVSAVTGKLWASGLPMWLVAVLAVLLGAVLGAVNGVFITRFGLPSLAVTIGTLALYRGLAFVVLGDQAVADFPANWTTAAIKPLPGTSLPVMVLPVAALALAFVVLLHATPTGRALYAMGNNDQAATFAGVPVARTKFWLFTACGAVSALAGVYWSSPTWTRTRSPS